MNEQKPYQVDDPSRIIPGWSSDVETLRKKNAPYFRAVYTNSNIGSLFRLSSEIGALQSDFSHQYLEVLAFYTHFLRRSRNISARSE